DHDADEPAQMRDLRPAELPYVIAVDGHFAGARELVADEEPDEGRFAGARGSDEEREVSLVDREIDVLERRGAVGVALADVFQTDQIRWCPSSSASKRHVAVRLHGP